MNTMELTRDERNLEEMKKKVHVIALLVTAFVLYIPRRLKKVLPVGFKVIMPSTGMKLSVQTTFPVSTRLATGTVTEEGTNAPAMAAGRYAGRLYRQGIPAGGVRPA